MNYLRVYRLDEMVADLNGKADNEEWEDYLDRVYPKHGETDEEFLVLNNDRQVLDREGITAFEFGIYKATHIASTDLPSYNEMEDDFIPTIDRPIGVRKRDNVELGESFFFFNPFPWDGFLDYKACEILLSDFIHYEKDAERYYKGLFGCYFYDYYEDIMDMLRKCIEIKGVISIDCE